MHRYRLVPFFSKTSRIPGALMLPMNIQKHNTIDKHGSIIWKIQLTYDQSYKWGSGTSLNSRVEKDELPPCMFCWCIKYIINWVVAERREFPRQRILSSKIDYKSAYWRCHLNANTTIQMYKQRTDKDPAIVALSLTVGGASGPHCWGVISENQCVT